MANFFNEIDLIYCLCIESRKDFVISQFARLGFLQKLRIVEAYTPESPIVKNYIKNHLVYPIYTNNLVHVACTLGRIEIMNDIVKNNFNYAMIIEDDVIFLEELFPFANQWINKETIQKNFCIDKPYILYLQCSNPENLYRSKGITKANIKYGEPALILNQLACRALLKYLLPITSPFDQTISIIKPRCRIQQGILVPYICRELSKNSFNFNTASLHCHFNRTASKNKKITLCQMLESTTFYLSTVNNSTYQKILSFLIKCMNPNVDFAFNKCDQDQMICYQIGKEIYSLSRSYAIGCTICKKFKFVKRPVFIISVRGKKSYHILRRKYGITPVVGDILLLMSRFYKKTKCHKYRLCFLYHQTNFQISCDEKFIFVNPDHLEADALVEIICSSEYIISDNLNYIVIGHSYSIPGVLLFLSKQTSLKSDAIDDYYSNFSNDKINPIMLENRDNTLLIDEIILSEIMNFKQPTFPINFSQLELLEHVMPFVSRPHTELQDSKRYIQIVKTSR